MKAHQELKKLLTSKQIQAFVADICHHAYPWSERVPIQYLEYKIFEEFRLREDSGETTRLGLDKKLQLIPDVVMFVKPGFRALNQQQCFTVALEIKQFKDDLMRDEKMWKYVGWTDFFFIAVPDDLVDYAFKKVVETNKLHPETECKIGVLGLETGELYSRPKRSEVSIEKQNLVLQNAVYNYAFKDVKTIVFAPEKMNIKVDDQANKLQKDEEMPKENNTQKTRSLSKEEKIFRKAAFKERQRFRRQQAAELAEKSTVLNEDIRQRLTALPPKAQEVFWSIRSQGADNGAGGLRQCELANTLGYSERTTSSCLSSLTAAGLIERNGSKKTGAYVVSSIAACDTTCATCSIALQCKDFIPSQQQL